MSEVNTIKSVFLRYYPKFFENLGADLDKNGKIERNEKIVDADKDGIIGSEGDFMDYLERNVAYISQEILKESLPLVIHKKDIDEPTKIKFIRKALDQKDEYMRDDDIRIAAINQIETIKDDLIKIELIGQSLTLYHCTLSPGTPREVFIKAAVEQVRAISEKNLEVKVGLYIKALKRSDISGIINTVFGAVKDEQTQIELIRKTLEEVVDDRVIRITAVEHIGAIKNELTKTELIEKALGDNDYNIRTTAVEQIGVIKNELTRIKLIKKALEDEDSYVCRAAVEQIGTIKNELTRIELIKKALEDESPQVLEAANDQIKTINNPAKKKELEKIAMEKLATEKN